jgi:fumarylacetoacetase
MASSTSTPRASWLDVSPSSHFSLANIPFGVISTSSDATPRPAVALGEYALDLNVFTQGNGFSGNQKLQDALAGVFSQPTLNAFAAKGRPFHREVRAYLQDILAADTKLPQLLKDNASLREKALLRLSDVKNHVPMAIGDYTDFYVGKHHAFNVGVLFRGPANALQPNYTHLPVAYHGRASSIVVSGTPIRRPWGQILLDPKAEPKVPTFTPSKKVDLELELGMFVCGSNELGQPIPVSKAEDYIFGYVLLNDWSARDVQAWEYVPLGPFTSKNLGSSISPWIVLADALEDYKTAGIENDTEYARYLRQPAEIKEKNVLGIDLEVELISKCMPRKTPKSFSC